MIHLRLEYNQLNDAFPSVLFNLPNLQLLSINNNAFSNIMPITTFSNSLAWLYMSHNLFHNQFPFQNISHSVIELHIDSNSFTGSVPTIINEWSLLEYLDISNNKFVGNWNIIINTFSHLIYLIISNNKFSGNLTNAFTFNGQSVNNYHLSVLDAGNNGFTGI